VPQLAKVGTCFEPHWMFVKN